MLFHITQTHTPESCPRDAGGSDSLFDPGAKGISIKAMYGAYAEHTIFYLVEAEGPAALNQFLMPGLTRCACDISVVKEEPIKR
jgi:hypothetical protein